MLLSASLITIRITFFSKIHSNIILPPTPMSSEWSLFFRFSDYLYEFISPMCANILFLL